MAVASPAFIRPSSGISASSMAAETGPMPWLYLKGISTGDFSEALAALPGPEAPGLLASTITRLKAEEVGQLRTLV